MRALPVVESLWGTMAMTARDIADELAKRMQPPATAVPTATFDTHVASRCSPGSAAKAARYEPRSRGFDVSVNAHAFRAHGYEAPQLDGELLRAAQWAKTLRPPARRRSLRRIRAVNAQAGA